MKPEVRPLFGEHFKCWEIAIPGDAKNSYAKLLKRAARLVEDLSADSVHVSGITWSGDSDLFAIYVFASRS